MVRRALVVTGLVVALFLAGRWLLVERAPAQAETTLAGGATPAELPSAPAPAAAPAAPAAPAPPPDPTAPDQQAATGGLDGYQAIYDLKLHDSTRGGGVAFAEGRMVMEFINSCDGYVLNQRLQLKMGDGEGGTTSSDYRVASWEARDGKNYRFTAKHLLNGEVADVVDGQAVLDPSGGGSVVFTKPSAETLTLPAGTLFPTQHTVAMLEAAKAGKRIFEAKLFDGSELAKGFDVVALIGRDAVAEPPRLKDGKETLSGRQSWPVQIAFYKPAEKAGSGGDDLPDYEVGFRLYPGGVTADMLLDYGDFSIDAFLTQLKTEAAPACGG